MGRRHKGIGDILHHYNNAPFKPENFQELQRIFGPTAAIDMNRLVCQHQQHVASAYMRRIRRDKIKQRDGYYNKLQNLPLKIKRMAVGPDYQDPYTSLKLRLPKLGHDRTLKLEDSPRFPGLDGSRYVPHNSLAPHINVLFKQNPGGSNSKGDKPSRPEDHLPFSLSPRKARAAEDLPPIKKRFQGKIPSAESSDEGNARCPTNTPRAAAFWSFNIPSAVDRAKGHVTSIPRGKDALAAISSVQKHNKPLPAISVKA